MEENTELTPKTPHFPTGNREFWLLGIFLLAGIFFANCALFYGLNLGFALISVISILVSAIYLLRQGCRLTPYTGALLMLSILAALSHLRSDDNFVKFVMLCFTLVGANLALCLMAGQNRRSPKGLTCLADVPRTIFVLSFGGLSPAWEGLKQSTQDAGTAGKNRSAALVGILIAIPVVAILIPLLTKADAAFEGLLSLLPQWDMSECVASLILGVPSGILLYSRNVSLKHRDKEDTAPFTSKAIHPITVNTVLCAVCVVYLVYLLSQLSYFVGGFSGLLPEGYTMADYARRGFFEMAWLSILNLTIITLSIALVAPKNGAAPLFTRILCLFIGLVSLALVGTASAKMFLYIGSYGLTRLRLLTEVIMIFIALTVIFVSIWLFARKFAYMKAVVLAAMVMGICVAWADVDTCVAYYNVSAYQSGQLESVDLDHLTTLGDGAVPYIEKLTQAHDLTLRNQATQTLNHWYGLRDKDLRAWNLAGAMADPILEKYDLPEEKNPAAEKLKALAYYEAMTEMAQQLYSSLPVRQILEPATKLAVKEGAFWLENGDMIEPFCSYDALWYMKNSSVDTIYVNQDCVILQSAATDNHILLWTSDAERSMTQLWQEYPQAQVEALIDDWYLVELWQEDRL